MTEEKNLIDVDVTYVHLCKGGFNVFEGMLDIVVDEWMIGLYEGDRHVGMFNSNSVESVLFATIKATSFDDYVKRLRTTKGNVEPHVMEAK